MRVGNVIYEQWTVHRRAASSYEQPRRLRFRRRAELRQEPSPDVPVPRVERSLRTANLEPQERVNLRAALAVGAIGWPCSCGAAVEASFIDQRLSSRGEDVAGEWVTLLSLECLGCHLRRELPGELVEELHLAKHKLTILNGDGRRTGGRKSTLRLIVNGEEGD